MSRATAGSTVACMCERVQTVSKRDCKTNWDVARSCRETNWDGRREQIVCLQNGAPSVTIVTRIMLLPQDSIRKDNTNLVANADANLVMI